ncbi:MAG TPA: SH3 domain-containing protein [Thermoanaerobaculia bacterium]|nr:SH3 domain-containing protein [Thermoanaerobaculia bacterium]
MRRVFLLTLSIVLLRCATPAPPPVSTPEPEPAPVAAPVQEEKVIGTVTVTASALNVRKDASPEGEVLVQVKKGASLDVLANGDSWTKVRLADGSTGWVASRFVAAPKSKRPSPPRKKGCPADSDYAFVETPTPRFSDSGAHGVVVVEATVNTNGTVTATKVLSNETGDEALAFLTEKEIKSAKFSPPIRNCVARSFIFTYRRTF